MPSTACFHCWRSCRCRAFVATPLLRYLACTRPAMRKSAITPDCWSFAAGLRHLPELHRLILFDAEDAVMRLLGQTIDCAIQRQSHHTLIERPNDMASLEHLRRLLRGLLDDESLNHYESHRSQRTLRPLESMSSRPSHSGCTHDDCWNDWSAITCDAMVIMSYAG